VRIPAKDVEIRLLTRLARVSALSAIAWIVVKGSIGLGDQLPCRSNSKLLLGCLLLRLSRSLLHNGNGGSSQSKS
jgi:hypothetical protein